MRPYVPIKTSVQPLALVSIRCSKADIGQHNLPHMNQQIKVKKRKKLTVKTGMLRNKG